MGEGHPRKALNVQGRRHHGRSNRHEKHESEWSGKEGEKDLTNLVRDHTTDGAVEDAARSTVMERTGLLGVDQMTLVQELVVT